MSGNDGRPPSDDRRDSASGGEGWTSEREEQNPERTPPNVDRENEDGSRGGGGRGDAGRGDIGEYRTSDESVVDRIGRLARADNEWVAFAREVLSSVAAVVAVGLLLFAISGVWPPMVAVESNSMVPHMQKGDLVFVMEEQRLVPESAHGETGVVTAAVGDRTGYTKFKQPGDVVVYQPNGNDLQTPIIHRAMLWVERGENWYDEANPAYVGSAENCEELARCPAPHAGFITKGDHNSGYDQALGISTVVRPGWIIGTAEVRIPYLGWIRLSLSTLSSGSQPMVANVAFETADSADARNSIDAPDSIDTPDSAERGGQTLAEARSSADAPIERRGTAALPAGV